MGSMVGFCQQQALNLTMPPGEYLLRLPITPILPRNGVSGIAGPIQDGELRTIGWTGHMFLRVRSA